MRTRTRTRVHCVHMDKDKAVYKGVHKGVHKDVMSSCAHAL